MKLLVLSLLMLSVSPAFAQGGGVYVQGGAHFGQQGCGLSVPREIKEVEKKSGRIEKTLQKIGREIDRKERDRERAENDYNDMIATIAGHFANDPDKAVANELISQATANVPFDGKKDCPTENKPFYCVHGVSVDKASGVATYPLKDKWALAFKTVGRPDGASLCSIDILKKGFAPPSASGTPTTPAPSTTTVEVDASSHRLLTEAAKLTSGSSLTSSAGSSIATGDCVAAVNNLWTKKKELDVATATVRELEIAQEQLGRQLDRLEDRKQYALEDWQDELASGRSTAAGFCYTCMNGGQREVSTADKVASLLGGVVTAGAGIWAVNQQNKANTALGYATNPMVPWATYTGAGALVMGGIYGAMGGGAGAYGCGGNFAGGLGAGGGAFGYPAGLYGGAGGGVFGPGMMYSGYVNGFPGYISGAGAIGAYQGMPYAAMPYAPYSGGFAIGSGIAIGGGMMPYSAMPFSPVGGGFAIGSGMAIGGGMMPYAAMPYAAIGGGMAIGGGFAIGGGMMPYSAMPYQGGGFAIGAGMMPYQGMPYQGGGYASSMAAMQYQMQMMQMYQSQMNSWMQEQQRMQQEYSQRTLIVSRLQEELVRIQSQIQQISYGGYGAGYSYSAGGASSTYLAPTGYTFDPLTGTSTVDPNLGNPARGRNFPASAQ